MSARPARRRGNSLASLTPLTPLMAPQWSPISSPRPQYRVASTPSLSTLTRSPATDFVASAKAYGAIHSSGQVSEDEGQGDDEAGFLVARQSFHRKLMRQRYIPVRQETETEDERGTQNGQSTRVKRQDEERLARQFMSAVFYCLRFLAIPPALLGTLLHLVHFVHPPPRSPYHLATRADYFAAAAWSILTAVQCWSFTSGLLTRWKAYYPLGPTFIRLIGLQAICWPATWYTLVFAQYDGVKRPLLCWTLIGTTTCVTRSIVMWVTSNIYKLDHPRTENFVTQSASVPFGEKADERSKERIWDWNEVVWKCAFPAGICYFITAWSLLLGREFFGC